MGAHYIFKEFVKMDKIIYIYIYIILGNDLHLMLGFLCVHLYLDFPKLNIDLK
jgi:hypothetical protein